MEIGIYIRSDVRKEMQGHNGISKWSLHKAKYLMTMQQRVSVHFDGAPTQKRKKGSMPRRRRC
ncbi:hypothetical protein BLOT_007739 [Blomia tropicalis]|nr:hypothetical protein BLOT_007739 [Blomia tropicalis]